jgi:hypothetical protein
VLIGLSIRGLDEGADDPVCQDFWRRPQSDRTSRPTSGAVDDVVVAIELRLGLPEEGSLGVRYSKARNAFLTVISSNPVRPAASSAVTPEP